jgi:hypothetical protein
MDAKKEFADLKFKIECAEIVLSHNSDGSLVVRGPGEIWQDENGVLQYKIFTDQAGYRSVQKYSRRPSILGEIIPEGEFFSLHAREYDMPRWTARRIIPSCRGGLDDGLAYGRIPELVQIESSPANRGDDFVRLRLKGKLNFPCNQGTQTEIRVGGMLRRTANTLNAAFLEDRDYRFEILHEQEHTTISLRMPAGKMTSATASRIHESLQFILGEQLVVMVIETNAGVQQETRLVSPLVDRGHGDMPPPLKFGWVDLGGDVWRMFCNYFRFVHQNASAGWHPISNHIGRVIESTAASVDTEILALGVAVEGLVSECFSNLAPVSADFLNELDGFQAAIQSGTIMQGDRAVALSAKTKERITGLLGAMRSPRNSDMLRAFISNNRLPSGLYNSWSRLRNSSAHGGGPSQEVETILRLRNEVRSLLYSIAFAAIGYTGPRTDYSLPGRPTRAWPIPHPPSVAPASAPVNQNPGAAPGGTLQPITAPSIDTTPAVALCSPNPPGSVVSLEPQTSIAIPPTVPTSPAATHPPPL